MLPSGEPVGRETCIENISESMSIFCALLVPAILFIVILPTFFTVISPELLLWVKPLVVIVVAPSTVSSFIPLYVSLIFSEEIVILEGSIFIVVSPSSSDKSKLN